MSHELRIHKDSQDDKETMMATLQIESFAHLVETYPQILRGDSDFFFS